MGVWGKRSLEYSSADEVVHVQHADDAVALIHNGEHGDQVALHQVESFGGQVFRLAVVYRS